MVWKPFKSLSRKQSNDAWKRLVPFYLVKHWRHERLDLFTRGIDGRYRCDGSLTFPIYGIIGGLAGCLFTNHTLARKRAFACWHGSFAYFQYCMVICGRECALANATRGVSNAFALEFPPFDARPKLKLLPRWICRSSIGESDANCACSAWYRHDHCGYAGVCCRLFYYFRFGTCGFRYLVFSAVFLVDCGICDYFTFAYSTPSENSTTTSWCAIFNDRTYYGCLLKYCNGETIFTWCERSELCKTFHGRIYGHRACTDAFGEFIRYLNLCNQYFLNVKHRDFRCGVVAKWPSRCGSSGYSNRDGVTCKWPFSLDYVGISSFIWKYRDSEWWYGNVNQTSYHCW